MCTQTFTIVCVVGDKTPLPQIVQSGLDSATAGEIMLSLENGSYLPFSNEKVRHIQVRDDAGGPYLTPDEFFNHRY